MKNELFQTSITILYSQLQIRIRIGTLKKSITDSFPQAIRQNSYGWGAHLNDDELKLIRKEVENFYLNGESIENASQSTLCDVCTVHFLLVKFNVITFPLPTSHRCTRIAKEEVTLDLTSYVINEKNFKILIPEFSKIYHHR